MKDKKELFSSKKNLYSNKKLWLTLIEMMISITIFSMIILVAFEAMWNISILRVKMNNRLDINQDLYYAVENLATTIKDLWWDIDYEEYWNRSRVWTSTSSWHYNILSWFGNYWSWWNISSSIYWSWFYFCASGNWSSMWTWWCNSIVSDNNYQRYWQYQFQFIDYNSNMNDDTTQCWWWKPLWDEDCDWNIRWDDDDENLWIWPQAFSGNEVKELYLIKKWKISERYLFRLNIIQDPKAPPTSTCNSNWSWTWCLGNIQILKLVWEDLWMSHTWTSNNPWLYDWIIDTWKCNKDYNCAWNNWLPSWTWSEWINLLPEYINVKDFRIFLYPNKDNRLSWKEDVDNIAINPYIRINMTLWYSWERRRKINWINPLINISTTINLTRN